MARDGEAGIRRLARAFVAADPDEAASVCERADLDQVSGLVAREPAGRAAELLRRLSADTAARLLAALPEEPARGLLSTIEPNRAAGLLARLEPDERERCLARVGPGLATELTALMSYPENSAGQLMDPRVLSFRPDAAAREVARRMRTARRGLQDVFVVDEEGRLAGAVSLQDLFLARPEQPLSELVRGPTASVQALAPREEVVELLERHGSGSLAVVDFEGRLLGVLRQDELIEAAQREATADLVTMVGAGESERALSPASFAVRKRLPWLEVNLLTAFLAASVVGLFEGTIARFTALAVLLPVVAGQSGNTGAQALAVTMRGLALREVRTRQWLRVTAKEVSVGLLNGIAVALTTSLAVWVWSRSIGLALVIGLSMVVSMTAAGLAGAVIPMLLTALRQDPAQSSSIILTTVTDVVGFFSFLGIATALASLL